MDNTMFGKRLAHLRKQRGLTQTELANEIGMSHASVASWETGKRDPDSAMISKIASFFNTTTDYLLGLDETDARNEREHGSETINMKGHVGCRLGEIIKDSGYRQDYVARQVGVSQANLSRLAAGKMIPTIHTAYRISRFFDKSIEEVWPWNEVVKEDKE